MNPRAVLLLSALALALLISGPQLYWRSQIKGIIPGATEHTRTVLEKWHQTPAEHPRNRNVYWLRIAQGDIREEGQHRIHLPPTPWRKIDTGSELKLVSTSRSSTLYMPEGIHTSAGNFIYDLALLALELGCAALMAWQLRRRGSLATS